jgi:hypothetical protein
VSIFFYSSVVYGQTNVLEKQLTDILKRWISNVATFEKVRENSTGRKYGEKIEEKKVRGKIERKSHVTSVQDSSCSLQNMHSNVTRTASPGKVGCAHARSEGTKNEFI